jgi:hypothetical protein
MSALRPSATWPIPVALAWVALALLAVLAAATAADRPPEVLSWRHQILSTERYGELAQQWERYAQEHPGDARAWVEWADALRYSGARDAANEKYARAFAIDSTDAAAATAFACIQVTGQAKAGDWELGDRLLRRVMERHPDFPDAYYMLWVTALRRGDEALAQRCLRRLVETGDMPRPLVDYGYNMLVGAPLNAIVLTNGDNDTYPPLAVQALRGLRLDVAIVNLSLLNTEWYIRYQRDRGVPIPFTDAEIAGLKATRENLIATQVVRALNDRLGAQAGSRPLRYSVTVPAESRKLPGRSMLEGLLVRIEPGALTEAGHPDIDEARTRELIDTVYRMESATDPFVDWERESSVANLALNYASLLMRLGEAPPAPDAACDTGAYLYRAAEILAAHRAEGGEMLTELLSSWAQMSPTSPWLERARRLVASAETR